MLKNISAIILAAGYSSRMGRFKPLLPLGHANALERAIALFRTNGVNDVRVVVGHKSAAVEPVLKKHKVRRIFNQRYAEGMYSSVTAGVASLEDHIDAFFLLPVDIPMVSRQTVRDLLRAHAGNNSRILYPCFRGEQGHPPLIPTSFREGILAWHGNGGLKSFLAELSTVSTQVAVADDGVLLDMDTPDDYRKLQSKLRFRTLLTPHECRALLRTVARDAGRLAGHCQAVADVARCLGTSLMQRGCRLDMDLLIAAALLHDIAKGTENHAETGARFLRAMGFEQVADLVACHMHLVVSLESPISEAEVLFLSDKLVKGDRLVGLTERFRPKLQSFAADSAALMAAKSRWRTARIIQRRIECCLSRPLYQVLEGVNCASHRHAG
jgi:molybdenum cofactor cytidylyltransferase